MSSDRRLGSGVPGLDPVLGGGMLCGGIYLLAGGPGTGKTVIANQVCFSQAALGRSCVYFTVLAESHSRMVTNLESLAFFDQDLLSEHVAYMSGAHALRDDGLDGLFALIEHEVRRRGPVVLVLDGLAMGAKMTGESESDLSSFLNRLGAVLEYCNCTAIVSMLSELGLTAPAYALADGLIELSHRRTERMSVRELYVRKLRGTAALDGVHPFEITSEGVTIYPRIESRSAGRAHGQARSAGRCRFGIDQLDVMLEGGVPEGSVTAVVGSPGAGKTLLGTHLLVESARRGRNALYFGCLESPGRLIEYGEGVGLPIGRLVGERKLAIVWRRPFENLIDAVVAELMSNVEGHRARYVYIDGLDLLMRTSAPYESLLGLIAAMLSELRSLGVTSLISVESEAFGIETGARSEWSPLVDNVILLRHLHQRSEVKRLLWILKMRGSGFDRTMRELAFASSGIRVGGPLEPDRPTLEPDARQHEDRRM